MKGRQQLVVVVVVVVTVILCAILFFAGCTNAEIPTVSIATIEPTLTAPTATVRLATPTRPTNTPTRIPATATSIPPTATPVPTTPAPTNTLPPPTLAPLASLSQQTVAGWNQFVASLAADSPENAQAQVDQLWDTLTKSHRVPLLLNDGAVFLFKGNVNDVTWNGDFSYWEADLGIDGKRIGQTDLWYGIGKFPQDSRIEYQVIVNGGDGIIDPANPHTHGSPSGDNSVLTMPKFQTTDFTKSRADGLQGTLTDWMPLASAAWGAPINYRVYTPPGYDTLNNLPVLYVTDGNYFSDAHIVGTQFVIDNLIADGKIKPIIAVFIDARDPTDLKTNLRNSQFLLRPEQFAEMITGELVPLIDKTYHTDATREGRTLLGVSYGGAFTTFAGLKYPEVFGNLTIFSPAYWVFGNASSGTAAFSTASQNMYAFVQQKFAQPPNAATAQKIFMSGGIPGWDVGDLQPWFKSFQHTGSRIQLFHSQEGHAWEAWGGLTDEMLEYFFAK